MGMLDLACSKNSLPKARFGIVCELPDLQYWDRKGQSYRCGTSRDSIHKRCETTCQIVVQSTQHNLKLTNDHMAKLIAYILRTCLHGILLMPTLNPVVG